MRILSGGHDFEGRSYVADVPFFILNMFYFRSISIDAKSQTAWVGAAATLGETYYAITQFNSSLAFPAGYCPTIAFGGHAIRGGTGASFGVILAYKIKLVEVPKKFTAFSLTRTLQQNATKLVHQWQSVAPKLPADLLISLQLTTVKSSRTGKSTVAATFVSAFQGGVDELLYIMQENFPELGLVKGDCTELSWVEYIAFHFGLPKESTYDMLLGKIAALPKDYFKAKSDLVQRPIPEEGLKKIWNLMKKMESPPGRMEWIPFGARMDEIPESEIPFPHRAGNLFLGQLQCHYTPP
ncbi:berberine bridge enzyme-like 8 [Coffea eugenioides]|uniref:berberine bridge enzyme-like 8 n=1 Tax=Coffea eugenioides TaxID=49369 RepID=UPI000F60C4F1|nr:berberine bridge enzyme-like 8 [Coffea eugenioides]